MESASKPVQGSEVGRTVIGMTVWVEQVENERIIHGDEDGLLRITGQVDP